MKTLTLSFPDDKSRERYLQLVQKLGERLSTSDVELLAAARKTMQFDVAVEGGGVAAAVFVTGVKMIEGSKAEMERRFQQEIGAHQADVELRELRGGEWINIRSRKRQRASQ